MLTDLLEHVIWTLPRHLLLTTPHRIRNDSAQNYKYIYLYNEKALKRLLSNKVAIVLYQFMHSMA